MPDWKDEIRRLLAGLRLAPTREAEIVEELSQHLDDRYEQLIEGGATVEEARRAALEELTESDLLGERISWATSGKICVTGCGCWRRTRGSPSSR
jgi:hypothetical protein